MVTVAILYRVCLCVFITQPPSSSQQLSHSQQSQDSQQQVEHICCVLVQVSIVRRYIRRMGLPKCLGGEEVVCEDVLRMPCTALGGFWTEVRLSFVTFNYLICSQLGGYQDRDNLQQRYPEK